MPTYLSGSDGRLLHGDAGTPLAGVTKWAVKKEAAAHPVTNHDSPRDAAGRYYEELAADPATPHKPAAGIVTTLFTVEGYLDVAAGGNGAVLDAGSYVLATFLHSRTVPFGYVNLPCVVVRFEAAADPGGDAAQGFAATLRPQPFDDQGNATLPVARTVTAGG